MQVRKDNGKKDAGFNRASSFKQTNDVTYDAISGSNQQLFTEVEVNSTWLITSELANQRAQKVLLTCVVYTNCDYFENTLYYAVLFPRKATRVDFVVYKFV